MVGRWKKRKNVRRGIIVKYAVGIKQMRSFPYAERNAMKKQLVISELDFEIHIGVYQEYGNWEPGGEERERESDWCVRIKYSNGIEQEILCYDGGLADKPEELYLVCLNILRRRKTADCLLLTLSCQTKRFQAGKIKNLYGENFLLICI